MNSVAFLSSGDAVDGLLGLVKAGEPIADMTWGNGTFWKDSMRRVIGMDALRERARDVVSDFRALPFRDASFPTVIFDPPFHPTVGSAEEQRFQAMGRNEKEMRHGFETGLRECWRVTARHLIVKCQGFVHNHAPQWMPLWAIAICGEPFEWLIVARTQKRISGRWKTVRSLRRNHADWLVFDKKGNKR